MQKLFKLSSAALTAVLGLSLQACQSPQYEQAVAATNKRSQLELEIADLSKKSDAALRDQTRRYVAELRTQGCKDMKQVVSGVVYNAVVSKFEESLKLGEQGLKGSIHYDKMFDTHIESSRTLAESRLAVADAALSARCYDVASFHYRGVIAFFIGPAYAAYRQRAEIGLRDIRPTQVF